MGPLIDWLSGHTLAVLLAIGTAFTFAWLVRFRARLRMPVPAAAAIAVLHTVYGVFCVSVFAVIEGLGDPASVGNMSLFGGVFFMPIAYFAGAKLSRRSMAQVFDLFTICMVFTLLCARVNCLLTGCCRGALIPGLDGARWPTREAELLFYVILLLILGRKVWAGKTQGEVYPIYMIAYGLFRFVVETFRESDSPTLFHVAHVWALISLCVGGAVYFQQQARGKKMRKRKVRR